MNTAAKELREQLNPGDEVYTLINHVSQSGMQRVIRVFIIRDNKPVDISYEVSKALGRKLSSKHDGVVVNGCGMDMGFHVVYSLSCVVFAADEYAEEVKNNMSKDVWQRDKGYWLVQRWL